MNTSLQTARNILEPASPETLKKLGIVHEKIIQYEQVPISTEHVIHGGMYVRTIRLHPGTIMEGSLVKLATILIVSGDTAILDGDEMAELTGYNVIAGCAGRKQIFATRGEVGITMIYPTQAQTVKDAEDEVFAESDILMSRLDNSRNIVNITGVR